jgi:5-methyltetrahydropteroyltriglutamate--homocysteine methyltransferase
MADCVGEIRRVRSLFDGVLVAMQGATAKPFKISFLGPSQNSVIVHDLHYKDNKALAMDLATALNEELRYLHGRGLECIQIIDVLPPYTQEHWQIDVLNHLVEGLDDVIKLWHVCYGSVDGQTDVWEDKVAGNIKRVLEAEIVPPERLFVMPDCGLGYCSRSVAAGKLRAMGEGVRMAREGL